MSDGCWFSMNFKKEDLPKFKTVLQHRMYHGKFWDEEDSDEENMDVIVYDANYGWYDEIASLADAGLIFTVSHGAGSDYGPCNYACYKGKLVGCNADSEGTPVVQVTKEGVDKQSLDNCMKYYEVLKQIETSEN